MQRERSPDEVRGLERTLEVRLGSLGGFELRPTRLFLWTGTEREQAQRVVPLGERPAGLEHPRHETSTRAGAVEVRTRGNPLLTIAMASVIAFKRWADAPDETERR